MRTVVALLVIIVVSALVLGTAGCTGAPPTPTTAPRVASPVTAFAPAARTSSAASSPVAPASGPQISTPSPAPTGTPLAELTLPTSTPAPATPVIPSGLYVTYLNTQPDPPLRGAQLEFHVGFANNTSSPQDFRWIVYIYKPDNLARSYGETTVTRTTQAVGAHEVIGLGYWKLPLGGPCEDFVARVAWLDQDNHAAQFREPNGELFEKTLTVCPP